MRAGEKDSLIQREMEDILDQLKKRRVSNPRKHHRDHSAKFRMSSASKRTLNTEVLETDGGTEYDAFDQLMTLGQFNHQNHDNVEKDIMKEV